MAMILPLHFLKSALKYCLQKILGIQRYLYWFARYKIKTIHTDKKETCYFLFLNLLEKEKGKILDIGANIGVMSYHASKKFPERTIHAFEPIPLNLSILKKVVEKYSLSNVHVHPIALAEKDGPIEMVLPEEHKVTMHGLAHVVHESIDTFNDGKTFKVEGYTLDNWMTKEGISELSGIKLDVENYEYFVLSASQKTIDRFRPIIFTELWENANRMQCMDLLKRVNYLCYTNSGKQLEIFDPAKHTTQNFIFIPKEKAL